MPSKSPKQQRFFRAVKAAKNNPNAPSHLQKVANSMTASDIDDFANSVVKELKIKKAVLSILKDVQEPMYLQEEDEGNKEVNPVATTFHVKENWATYIKPYIGQPLTPKEIQAIETFKSEEGIKPTTVSRTEIWFKTSDTFSVSKTTLVKKMKDGGQFSYTAFQKHENPNNSNMDGGEEDMGSNPEDMNMMEPGLDGEEQPQQPQQSELPKVSTDKEATKEKEDIIVVKSILFKDDTKGAALLVEFLKKLDL